MTTELREKLKAAPMVLRGEVRHYHNDNGYKGVCLIVGADHRGRDKYVSMISLMEADNKDLYYDEVVFMISGKEYHAHCGMITYIRRDRVDGLISKLSREQMYDVDMSIIREMGMSDLMEVR